MSTYEFKANSYIKGKDGKDLPVTYSFDVDDNGAQLYEAIVGDLDLISWIDDYVRESLEVECLERMAADRMDNAIYQAECAETDSHWARGRE